MLNGFNDQAKVIACNPKIQSQNDFNCVGIAATAKLHTA